MCVRPCSCCERRGTAHLSRNYSCRLYYRTFQGSYRLLSKTMAGTRRPYIRRFNTTIIHTNKLIIQLMVGQWGKKAKVPDYANDQRHAYAIDEQMRKLGRLERYNKELSKTKAKNLPPEWATPEQRSRAALKALGKPA